MMLLAKERRTPPKDLGIDLLILKEKRQTFEETMPKEIIKAGTEHKYEPDPSGSFRICLKNGLILAQNGRTTVAGSNAREILNTIIDMELVTRLDHVGYLGRELEKAQIALSLKRSYIQDELLWPLEKG
jgi:dihydropteroate synthase